MDDQLALVMCPTVALVRRMMCLLVGYKGTRYVSVVVSVRLIGWRH